MWIETTAASHIPRFVENSFASNGECGLKLLLSLLFGVMIHNSFASNGECGLKQAGATPIPAAPA